MYNDLIKKEKLISVTGLGYVGLPLALEFGRHFKVIGFDIRTDRIEQMKNGIDPSKELNSSAFEGVDVEFTSNPEDLRRAHFHIIGVPTDIDEHKVPNLDPLLKASTSVGQVLKAGDFVVYESTVYPGCTEEECLPILERESNLSLNSTNKNPDLGFKLGYSPERIVPGSKTRTLTNILKIISGNDDYARDQIGKVYNTILTGGIHEAASIKVAEAAKVIENTQRDINISLMNELAIIFDEIGIDTIEVLEAAGTKWNFHKYNPGLVGGHCISVDPFYLMHKAKQIGLDPQVIAAGRRVNDYIPHFIAKRLVKALLEQKKNPSECKVLVKGITFKENVADIRNSKVVDLIRELMEYSLNVNVVDAWANPNEVAHEYGITLIDKPVGLYDAIIVAVNHKEYENMTYQDYKKLSKDKVILFDIKGMYNREAMSQALYWRL